MVRAGASRQVLAALAGSVLLSACAMTAPPPPAERPQTRPDIPGAVTPTAPAPVRRSEKSEALAYFYARLQQDLLTRGLLRTDGGGVDTPFDAWMLARNFENLAFYDEYDSGRGFAPSRGAPVLLRRWVDPVRMTVSFGASVPSEQRSKDRASVASYAARLGRVTGHPISTAETGNFHVFIVGEDDRPEALRQIAALLPSAPASTLALLRDLPRPIHCVVIAFSQPGRDQVYHRAVAVIRAEHPDLMRQSCIHEELAQGLGIANDRPDARPSIFNDDDEFALLTTHDEMLLRMLYHPRLAPGMSLDQARPILREIAEELLPGPV